MKKILLNGPIYKKFYDAGDKLFDDIKKGRVSDKYNQRIKDYIELLNYLSSFSEFQLGDGEITWRTVHYWIIDLPEGRNSYLNDGSKEANILKNSFLAFLQIVEHKKSSVIFQNISTWDYIEIVGEWEGSQSSLKDFPVGMLLFSRVLKSDGEYYIMKNFQYIWEQQDDRISTWLKIALKNINNLYDLHKAVEQILTAESPSNIQNKADTIVNNIRNIKKRFMDKMWKKFKFWKVKKLLESDDPEVMDKFIKICQECGFTNSEVDELTELAFSVKRDISYETLSEEEKQNASYVDLLFLEFQNFFPNVDFSKLSTEKRKQYFEYFLDIPNPSFDNKTPREFVEKNIPDRDSENLKIQYLDSQPEYNDFESFCKEKFTQKEKEKWGRYMKLFDEGYIKDALKELSYFRKKYPGFFVFETQYIILNLNIIVSRYDQWNNFFDFPIETLKKDFEFLLELLNYRQYIENLIDFQYENLENLKKNENKVFIPIAIMLLWNYVWRKENISKHEVNELTSKLIGDFDIDAFFKKSKQRFSYRGEEYTIEWFDHNIIVNFLFGSIWKKFRHEILFEEYVDLLIDFYLDNDNQDIDNEFFRMFIRKIIEKQELIKTNMKTYFKENFSFYNIDIKDYYKFCKTKITKDKFERVLNILDVL